MINRKIYVEMTESEFRDYQEYQKYGEAVVRVANKLCGHLYKAIEVEDIDEKSGCKLYEICDDEEMEEVQELAEKIRKLLTFGV